MKKEAPANSTLLVLGAGASIGAAKYPIESSLREAMANDLDFGKLLAFSRATHPSVIQFRAQDIRPSALGGLALQALKEHHTRLEGLSGEGALITIEIERFRTRILPLSPD
jgi:hypothetical protein